MLNDPPFIMWIEYGAQEQLRNMRIDPLIDIGFQFASKISLEQKDFTHPKDSNS